MRSFQSTGFLILLLTIIAASTIFVGCGSSGGTATVATSLSDPATCGPPQGAFSHIYVTVTDVEISQSATAGANDSSWVDLTPKLKNNPVQVDLLGVANQCFLATLGSTGIPAGNYQQIRVILASNGVGVSNNKCGPGAANCVMLTNDPSQTPFALQLSSEARTGIKIPSGQIAGGQFTVKAGDKKDFNIDFNACASIVTQGNGQYRLKPVLHAGEVQLQSTSTAISGIVVNAANGLPITGGTTVIALEQMDAGKVDRVIMETVAASDGSFSFCPVAAGSYDVVVSAVDGSGNVFAASVITGVQPGDNLANIPVTSAGAAASLQGQVTTSTGTGATSADVELAALQQISEIINNTPTTVMITTPLASQSAATANFATQSLGSCPVNTDCMSYTLALPASTPGVGAFKANQNQQITTLPILGSANYTLDATTFVPGAATQTGDCSPSEMQSGGIAVNTGQTVQVPAIQFSGCQ
ncbi:MAG TPA: DUF4382 domain-containing protein [Terriglobales bacterium]|nr:DUF4382 domain-containing protein [Terriglobales bacterium]